MSLYTIFLLGKTQFVSNKGIRDTWFADLKLWINSQNSRNSHNQYCKIENSKNGHSTPCYVSVTICPVRSVISYPFFLLSCVIFNHSLVSAHSLHGSVHRQTFSFLNLTNRALCLEINSEYFKAKKMFQWKCLNEYRYSGRNMFNSSCTVKLQNFVREPYWYLLRYKSLVRNFHLEGGGY